MAAALYLDGVSYSNVDSVLGIWVINLVNQERVLSVALRKKLLCSLQVASIGIFPERDFLQRAWTREGRLPNTAMRARFATLFVKGDWSEYSLTMGFPTWNDGLRPCFRCNASTGNLQDSA